MVKGSFEGTSQVVGNEPKLPLAGLGYVSGDILFPTVFLKCHCP